MLNDLWFSRARSSHFNEKGGVNWVVMSMGADMTTSELVKG